MIAGLLFWYMRFVMAAGKITKRTLDALQAGAVTGFLWDDD